MLSRRGREDPRLRPRQGVAAPTPPCRRKRPPRRCRRRPGPLPAPLLGTIGYMAPEQASGKPADFRADQFSFGKILYEVVSGHPRLAQVTLGRNARRRSCGTIPRRSLRSNAPPVPPSPVRRIIERCLSKDPQDRYASTRDLAGDLATLKDHLGEVSGASPRVRWRQALAPAPRGRRFFVIGALGVAALGAAHSAGASLLRKPDAAELGPDRFSSRRRLVRPLCPRRPDDRLQRGLGRRSRAALLDAAAVDRDADARPAARKAPGDLDERASSPFSGTLPLSRSLSSRARS